MHRVIRGSTAGNGASDVVKRNEIIYGRQAVKEALLAGNVRKILMIEGQRGTIVKEIVALARDRGISCENMNAAAFGNLLQGVTAAGGVAAVVSPYDYVGFDQLIGILKKKAEKKLVLILDHLEDPHNLGALIRTAEASGAMAVILPVDRSASVTPSVRKVSAGAAEWIPVARVTNLVRAISRLKEEGFWIYGAEKDGDLPFFQADWDRNVVLVLGSEGKGLSSLVRKKCDTVIGIPLFGKINSLNVSVAGGIVMYEFNRRKMT